MGTTALPSDRMTQMMEFARIAAVAQDIGSLRSDTLGLIRRIFRSDSTIFWLTDQHNRAVEPIGMNVQQHFFPMYRDYYHKINPFDPTNMRSFTVKSVSMEQIVPYNDFQKTEYFNDFIRPQKIRRQMVVYILRNRKLISVICTHRCRNRIFDRDDLAAGDMVSSHLSAAFDRIRLFEHVKRQGNFFRMIIDTADVGIAVLDQKKKPLFVNRKAADICAAVKKETIPTNECCPMDSALPAPVLDDCDAIKRCVEDDLEQTCTPLPVRERVLWTSSFEQCLFRSRIVDGHLTGFNQPLFLVSMETFPVHPGIDEHIIRRECSLTRRETEIVSHIFKGYTNAEIADRLFISEGTVKNHLRNIFEKVQVKNRTGLIHKVLSLKGLSH